MVSAATSAEVYVVPVIVPPPDTTDQVPPAGVADNSLVVFSQIAAVLVLFAEIRQGIAVELLFPSVGSAVVVEIVAVLA